MDTTKAETREVTDPVCGMKVDHATAKHRSTHAGEEFLFCSSRCKDKFDAEPETYLGAGPAPEPMPEGTIFTCPMHPEIEPAASGLARR